MRTNFPECITTFLSPSHNSPGRTAFSMTACNNVGIPQTKELKTYSIRFFESFDRLANIWRKKCDSIRC